MRHTKRCCICGGRIKKNDPIILVPCHRAYKDTYLDGEKQGNNQIFEVHDEPDCIADHLLFEIEKLITGIDYNDLDSFGE